MKYFKSATAYRMVAPIENLDALVNSPVHECAPGQIECHGWENPQDKDLEIKFHDFGATLGFDTVEEFVNAKPDGYTILCLVTVRKNLKPATIKREVDKIAKVIEKNEGRKVGRKERIDIKDDVIVKALPSALSEELRTYAYIDWKNNMLVIGEHSVNKCDLFISQLRDAIGSVKVEPLRPAFFPESVMATWLNDNAAPPDIELRGDAVFKNPADIGQTARVRHIEIDGAGVAGLLEDGMVPQELSLQWHLSETSHVYFKVTETVTLKEIVFSDDLLSDDGDYEDAEHAFNASMIICCGTITTIISGCFKLFGGVGE